MKKIYLFCSAGMSTSMLAQMMQNFADGKSLSFKVRAFSYDQLEEVMNTDRPDCILLGPQVNYLYDEVVADYKDTGVPIMVIDSSNYGTMNGEAVLKSAVKLMRKNDNINRGGK